MNAGRWSMMMRKAFSMANRLGLAGGTFVACMHGPFTFSPLPVRVAGLADGA